MKSTDRFRLEPRAEAPARADLVADGAVVVTVEGAVLEAQFRCSVGYLIVTADGNPFEEMLHLYLLGEGHQMLDELSLGRMYQAGAFRNPVSRDGDSLEFSFFGDERWQLSIVVPPRRHPFRRPFSAIRRAGSWLRPCYLEVSRKEASAEG